ncbi:MAG TPA: hypothetical protein VKG78_07145, partial [Opitutaceae bacterium]|nr:hypothetical protein [Opitutaceae bacterium]
IQPDLSLRLTRRLDNLLPVSARTDRVRKADILVQSGGPIYWLNPDGNCARTEWWEPLIERRWIPHTQGRPFLNLAGGTCQRYDSDASEFARNPEVLEHVRRFFDLTALTTLRDELSVKVLGHAGREGALLPCTSLFAVDQLGIAPSAGEFIVLNYMPAGGHYVFDKPIDEAAWERRFAGFARKLAARDRVVLACHNARELSAAQRMLPEIEVFHSDNHADYLRFYSRARWGILNRVHGCFALASLGKPSAVIGSDSRARMVQQLGLPDVFVNEATDEWLDRVALDLEQRITDFPRHMKALKESTAVRYKDLIRRALETRIGANGSS